MKPRPPKREPGKLGLSIAGDCNAIERDIERLEGLSVADLRVFWQRRFRRAPPPIQSADMLHRLIAWKLQVEAFGDLDPKTRATLKRLLRGAQMNGAAPGAAVDALKTGTVLVREWRGVVHRVLVLDDGFEHRDNRYRSLTLVARAITGTRWSGPRFFGLENVAGPPAGGTRP